MTPNSNSAAMRRYLLCPILASCILTSKAEGSGRNLPFKLGIRDSFMIAHSFKHPDFGPAQNLHGATYTCDIEFQRSDLAEPQNWVIDIGKASDMLSKVLEKYNFQNLDDMFPTNVLTTTEFMSKQIFLDLCERIKREGVEFEGKICIKLSESHKAWASFEGELI
jgi:6-pyruvoyltetrahydropterin/6-carboxytetrahydropterin synthase